MLALDIEPGFAPQPGIFRLHGTQRAERRHFGHAPGMDNLDVVVVLELRRDGARAGRAADDDLLQIGKFLAGLLQILQQHHPHRRHGGAEGHLLGVEQLIDRGAVHLAAGHHQLGADHRRALAKAPGIGMEHRHDRKDGVACREAHGVGHRGDHGVKHVRTMAVEDALRIARRARGVAHAGGGVLIERLPGEATIGFVKPFLIGDDIRQGRLRHVRLVGQHDHLLQRFDRAGDLLEQRHECQVDEDRFVLGIVHDPDDLLGKEAWIERMIDRPDSHDAVPGLDVARGIPGHCRDAVAKPKTVMLQPLGDLQGAMVDSA